MALFVSAPADTIGTAASNAYFAPSDLRDCLTARALILRLTAKQENTPLL
jgi:hypothetical protein